jgi:hypothetical protein
MEFTNFCVFFFFVFGVIRIVLFTTYVSRRALKCLSISRKVQLISQIHPFLKKIITFFVKIGEKIKYLPPSVRYSRIQDFGM